MAALTDVHYEWTLRFCGIDARAAASPHPAPAPPAANDRPVQDASGGPSAEVSVATIGAAPASPPRQAVEAEPGRHRHRHRGRRRGPGIAITLDLGTENAGATRVGRARGGHRRARERDPEGPGQDGTTGPNTGDTGSVGPRTAQSKHRRRDPGEEGADTAAPRTGDRRPRPRGTGREQAFALFGETVKIGPVEGRFEPHVEMLLEAMAHLAKEAAVFADPATGPDGQALAPDSKEGKIYAAVRQQIEQHKRLVEQARGLAADLGNSATPEDRKLGIARQLKTAVRKIHTAGAALRKVATALRKLGIGPSQTTRADADVPHAPEGAGGAAGGSEPDPAPPARSSRAPRRSGTAQPKQEDAADPGATATPGEV